MSRRVQLKTMVLAMLLLSGCRTGSARVTTITSASPSAVSARQSAGQLGGDRSPVMRIYGTKAKRWLSFDEMIDATSRADIVMIGEQHDDPVTHAFEVATVAAIGDRRKSTIVSMEMFERDVQDLVDQYLTGALNEVDFLASSRPWDRYATDYRPMLEIARVRGWRVVAANIPRRIASAVSKTGLTMLDTLNGSERSYAALSNECPHDRYFELFTESMGNHSAGNGPASAGDVEAARVITQRFYEAQCVKDEAMAESISRAFLNGGRRTPVVHVNGAFHSDYGLGTAERVKRRVPDAKLVIITAVPTADIASPDVAAYSSRGDFIVFTLRAGAQ